MLLINKSMNPPSDTVYDGHITVYNVFFVLCDIKIFINFEPSYTIIQTKTGVGISKFPNLINL